MMTAVSTDAAMAPTIMIGSIHRAVWPLKRTIQVDEGAEGSDHEDLAVGEVDQLDDPVDHGVADGDQGVQRSQGQPVDELLGEDVHATSRG